MSTTTSMTTTEEYPPVLPRIVDLCGTSPIQNTEKPLQDKPLVPLSSLFDSTFFLPVRPQSCRLPQSMHGLLCARDVCTQRTASCLISPSVSCKHYACPLCFKTFSRPSNLKIHTYSHTGERPFVCAARNCGRSFSVRSNMRRHMRIHVSMLWAVIFGC
ncbi:hypothetical protein PORY_001464 [Pneumocystis oryctolagi]|uniref:Uncharacterized protein n=1 Tax=Pneumocystis oryctolagi TaxID=42067 RepID=A0ACB7CEI4_9ASCO|nr:hypothetical protein PORY_001464 [Pneumocystis oryctolagi]